MQITNRKAHFNYTIEEEIEAGIVLVGSEVKSIRQAKVSLNESYIASIKGELFLVNANIAEYKGANNFNHDPLRPRKLLLHKKQIEKLISKIEIKGYSIVPLRIFFNTKNYAKIVIGVGKGKKLYDKRDTIKKRDEQRRLQRESD
jgi:SsrA-binding protein